MSRQDKYTTKPLPVPLQSSYFAPDTCLLAVEAGQAPPSRSTGAQIPCLPWSASGVSVLIDWLGFTVPLSVSASDIFPHLEWIVAPRGAWGYKTQLLSGHVKQLFDGGPGMDRHFELSGQGCREVEACGDVTDWQAFLSYLVNLGARFSRLDVAMDDKCGLLDMDEIARKLEGGEVTSRWHKMSRYLDGEIGSPFVAGSIRLGAFDGNSKMLCRIYDKALEQGQTDEHWMRVELQARDERAAGLAATIATSGASAIAGVIGNYLTFREVGTDHDKSRWQVCEWWGYFLGYCARVRLSVLKVKHSLDRAEKWLQRQVSPYLAMMAQAYQGDIGAVWDQFVAPGRARWRTKHYQMLQAGGFL